MHSLTVPYLAAALLLAVAGAAKLARPTATAQALRTQGLPSGTPLVTTLGVAELAVAAAALVAVPGGAWLLSLAYAGFTGFVLAALLRGRPLSSCGCFAEPDVPPTPAHVVLTGLLGAAAAAVGLSAQGAGLLTLAAAPVGTALAAGAAALLVTWLAYLVLTALPRLVLPPAARAPAVPALPLGLAPAGAPLLSLRSVP